MFVITQGFLSPLLITQGYKGSTVVPLVIYVDPRSVQLVEADSDTDPFGVDPRAVQLSIAGSDTDPFGIDPRACQLSQ